MILRLTHPTPEESKAYRLNKLSKIKQLKIRIHIDMCMECHSLFKKELQEEQQKLPLEEHLIQPKR